VTVQSGSKSAALFQQAQQLIPGGVNSPVRAFKSVNLQPPFIQRAAGARVYDVDGNTYIDYVGSWGPLILGHAHPQVVAAVQQAAADGCSFGAPTEREVRLAQLIVEAFPAMDMVRMVNSGTEATMTAIRLARGFTGRDMILKFAGCYHGHADSLLVKAGSGAMTFGVPDSPGVPADLARHTLTVPFNNLAAVRQALEQHQGQVAAVIVEPAAGNMGLVPPEPGFLEGLRQVTRAHGTLLIFDEVITGFRVAYGGMQTLSNIEPDLTALGKIVGGGLPVGAYGGRREIMEHMSPVGPVYQAGTLSGNPLAMAAGIATLELLRAAPPYAALAERTAYLVQQTEQAAKRAGVPVYITSLGSMFTLFFSARPIHNYDEASTCDIPAFRRYFAAMLQAGIYLAPSQFETGFLSTAHTDEDIAITLRAGAAALQAVAEKA
jgi:glutamate-1-semialdehyde 2,1-aminomutase